MQLSELHRPLHRMIPPLHRWPEKVKRLVLAIAIIFCVLAYLVMFGGIAGLIITFLEINQSF
ncbi:MAG: hypothetical protein R3264_00905 [Anaerolineae bacterium]|nr:hypothetical protein [Anaerolineae bacterium]